MFVSLSLASLDLLHPPSYTPLKGPSSQTIRRWMDRADMIPLRFMSISLFFSIY